MVRCLAFGCSDRPDTDDVKKSYFTFPCVNKDKSRLERWLHNIGTGITIKNYVKNKNNRVCCKHFHPDCFQENHMAKVLGYTPKGAALKPGSVPTIFGYKVYDVINMDGTVAVISRSLGLEVKKQEKKRVENVKSILIDETSTFLEQSTTTTASATASLNPISVSLNLPTTSVSPAKKRAIDFTPILNSSPLRQKSESLMSPIPVSSFHESFHSMDSLEDPFDVSYNPETNDSTVNTECSGFLDDESKNSDFSELYEKKYVVTERQLEQLFRKISCPECASPPDKIEKETIGTCIKVKTSCSCGFDILDWSSQPFIGKIASFNLLLAASILFSGGTYESVHKCAEYSGLEFINKSTFYQIQRNLLIPSVNKVYEESIKKAKEESKEDGNIVGDGRFDSPGKSAKYCTYSCQSPSTKKILATSTVQTKSGKGSSPLELETFINCLSELESSGVEVKKVSTDRNKQLAKWIRENKPNLKHRYDPWHFAKNIKGKLRPISMKKDCRILKDWVKPIANHVFYLATISDEDPEKMLQVWKSLLHHVTNRHTFKSFKKYPKCAHRKFTKAESRKKNGSKEIPKPTKH